MIIIIVKPPSHFRKPRRLRRGRKSVNAKVPPVVALAVDIDSLVEERSKDEAVRLLSGHRQVALVEYILERSAVAVKVERWHRRGKL